MKRTPQEQLAELDRRLGKGVGAVRERTKLAEKIARLAEAEKQERKAKRKQAA